ncbi:MAG: 50S ribosomal protein L29 [Gammaproteobacteria bacterium]|nr:50S ribosomal protein L29 [Gammaproteobacteria bacterium]
MKATELREKDMTALEAELLEQRKEQFNLRMQQSTGQLARPDQVKRVRREIARIKTVINEKSKAGDKS